MVESLYDEISDEEEDNGTTCKICKIPLIRTDGEMWRLGSMQYTRWMCLLQVLYDKRDISADRFFCYYFLQYLHRIINITDRFPFNCPFGRFPTFIESLLISIHWAKSFNFFSAYLLEIYQAQPKNSNYDVLLTAWLVSMKICPKGIFISVLPSFHLPVKIKVQKKNKTKRETLEAYSQTCKTSKMKLFAKNVTALSC